MGLTPGTYIKVVRFAPLGDPMDVEVRGYHLSLRRHEASQVSLTCG
jgi:Fe2+ transport system protein FeoA